MARHFLLPRLVLILLAALCLIGVPRARAAGAVMLAGFPTLRQQHSLTCESSAASMATRGAITETQLMQVMPRSPNPNLGFRGNPDGEETGALHDYGVYAQPLHNALLHYGYQSVVLTYATDATLRQYIRRGWPVITWISYALQPSHPRLVTYHGVQFFLVPHEHAVLAVGYDNTRIFANDPWVAHVVQYRWRNFNRSWGYFGNMALAVEPCVTAQPVSSIHLQRVSTASISWTWPAASGARQYHVTVTRGDHARVVYDSVISALHLTLPSPVPNTQYQITVTALSACGDAAAPTSLVAVLPATLPASSTTPTPTPAAERTVVVTPTAIPTATASPTPTATLSP